MVDRKVAFVTGASRGIGKRIALHLARAGFDVAITARTVSEGEIRENSSTIKRSDTRPRPGSLNSTAAAIEESGVDALVVPADLLDRASLGAAAATVLERWGAIDVLVNNARYVGPGTMDLLLDTPLELLDKHLEGNVMAPLVLIKQVLPSMLERGSGVVVNITSGAAYHDPAAPAGSGGWGLGYGFSKGALHRIAGIINLELGDRGIRAYNVQPGFVATERGALEAGVFGFENAAGAPPDVVGAVVAWLVTNPAAAEATVEPNGRNFEAQDVCRDLGLLPGWPAS